MWKKCHYFASRTQIEGHKAMNERPVNIMRVYVLISTQLPGLLK